jgi:hypothetical protein
MGHRERCHQPGLEPLAVSRYRGALRLLRFQGSLTSRLAPTRPNAPTFLMESSLPAVCCRLDFLLRATHLCLANAVIDQQFELPSELVRRKRRTSGFLPALGEPKKIAQIHGLAAPKCTLEEHGESIKAPNTMHLGNGHRVCRPTQRAADSSCVVAASRHRPQPHPNFIEVFG